MRVIQTILKLTRSPRVRAIAGNAAVTYLGLALSVVSTPMIAHELGASGRGGLAAAFLLPTTLEFAIFLGLPRTLSISYVRRGTSSASGLALMIALSVAGSLIIFVCAPALAGGDEATILATRVNAFLFLLSGLSRLGAEQLLDRDRHLWFNSYRASVLVLPSTCHVALFSFGALNFWTAFWAMAAGQCLALLISASATVGLVRASTWSTRVELAANTQLGISMAVDQVAIRIDQLAIATLLTPADLGIYAVAMTCAKAAGATGQAINQVAYSRLVHRFTENQYSDADSALVIAARITISLTSGAAIVGALGVWGDTLLGVGFAGIEWVVAILCIAQIGWDQWNWDFGVAVASERWGGLAASSLVGVTVVSAIIAVLYFRDSLALVPMAWTVAFSNASRLATYRYARHRRRVM